MSEFLVATMARVIKKVADVRVSESAALELGAVIDEYGTRVAKEAVKLCKHRRAKTLSKGDIRVAAASITR